MNPIAAIATSVWNPKKGLTGPLPHKRYYRAFTGPGSGLG